MYTRPVNRGGVMKANHPPGGGDGWPPGPFKRLGPGPLRAWAWALVGPLGPLWAPVGPCGPLGPCGPGPCGPALALGPGVAVEMHSKRRLHHASHHRYICVVFGSGRRRPFSG